MRHGFRRYGEASQDDDTGPTANEREAFDVSPDRCRWTHGGRCVRVCRMPSRQSDWLGRAVSDQVLDDVSHVGLHACDCLRPNRVREEESDEGEAQRVGDDAALVDRLALVVEDKEIDPRWRDNRPPSS